MAKIQGTAGTAPARRIVTKKPATKVVRKATAPVTDVQSSGGDYGRQKAAAYEKTPAARAPVTVSRSETVRDINTGKSHTVTVKYRPLAHPHNQGLDLVHFAAKGFNNLYGQHGGGGGVRGGGGAMIGPVGGGVPKEVIKANLEEAVKHPAATAKGIANQVIGTVGGIGQIALPTLQGHPGQSLQAIERLPGQIGKDYSNRYGPLLKGDVKGYEAGVHKSGAAPGLVDLASAATIAGGVTRPLTRALIKSVPKGEEFLTAARPALRTTGGKAVTQTLSHKPSRVVLQRTQDKLRQQVAEGGVRIPKTKLRIPARRADDKGQVGALQPQKTAVTRSIERHNAKAVTRGRTPVALPKRPDEVVPLSVKSKTFGAGRAQRIAVSRESARAYVANKHEQAQEIGRGINKAVAGLSPKQRHAVFHVTQGLLPIHGSLEDITTALKAREKQLVATGAPGPSVLRGQTELAQVRYLHKHAKEVFSDGNLAAFHAGEVARGKRVAAGDPALRAATQEARRYRPQGEMLGVKYELPPKATGPERDAYNTAYVARVKTAATAKGLPEPTYFKHEKRPLARLSNRTAGNLSKAAAGPKQTDMRLFRTGQAVATPAAYVRGVADTIKRKHQWPAVANVVAEHAMSWSRGKDGKGMTVEKLRDAIDHQGLRHEDFTFINPGLVRKADEGATTATSHTGAIRNAVEDSTITGGRADTLARSADPAHQQLLKTGGYFAVPKHAGDELLANTKPAGRGLRIAGRAQGLQSTAILGLNPSWLGMQFAANTLQSGVGMRGNLLDIAKGEPWYRSLTPAERQTVDRSLGVGLYEGTTTAAHLGAHQGKVAAAAEHLGQIPLIRAGGRSVRVTDLNPTRAMFRVDGAQNDFFRKAMFANAVKRQAFKDLTDHIGLAQRSVAQVADLLRLTPGETVADQMRKVLADPAKVEQATREVNDVLGDYLRYTHRERTFKNAAMFYGFLRYATKTLLYTLPVKHPLAAELALKLGQLHDDEVRRIFGTSNVPPWVYARSFQYDSHGNVVRKPLIGKDGEVLKVNGVKMMVPQSIDLGRINPLTGPVTDVVTGGPQALFGMMSPMVQAAFNVLIAKKNIGQDRPLTVGGSAAEAKSPTAVQDARMILNEGVVQPTFPGRLLMPKGAQTDDALPFLPEPTRYKTPAAQEKAAAKMAAAQQSGGLGTQLAPLSAYKPDTTGIYIATHGGGPVGKLDTQIKATRDAMKALKKSGRASENGGYETKQYADLAAHAANLEKQRTALLGRPAVKGVRLKKRPESQLQKLDARTQKRLDRLQNLDQSIEDRINKRLERLQVASGG